MCVWRSTFMLAKPTHGGGWAWLYREHRLAVLAGAQFGAAVELLEHRLDLRADVIRLERRIVYDRAALLAVPAEVMIGGKRLRLFHNQADGPSRPLRRVWHAGRQQKNLPLPD